MSKISKNMKAALAKYDPSKQYELSEACGILKDITYTKFDASVELIANLGVDPRKANQMIRGVVSLPLTEQVKSQESSYSVLLTRRLRLKRLVQTMLVSTNISKRSKAAGLMLTLSSVLHLSWPRSVSSVVSSVQEDSCRTLSQVPLQWP